MSVLKNYLETPNGITVVFDDKMIPLVSGNPLFSQVQAAVLRKNTGQVELLLDKAKMLKRQTGGKFWVDESGLITMAEGPLPEALSKRLLVLVDENLPTEGLETFWHNLKDNPSKESVKDLYAFLEHNGIPITSKGTFIAYKRVAENFHDLRTGKFDNTPGQVVKMDRDAVDHDRNNTCSTGLHVAAWNYAEGFYGNGHLLEVEVNPRDVVAVPPDYGNEKMRVCEYTVIRVAGKPREEPLVYSEGDTVEYVNPEDGEVIEVTIVKAKDGWPHRYDVQTKDDGTFLSDIAESDIRWVRSEDDDYDEDEDGDWDDEDDDDDDGGWGLDPEGDDEDEDVDEDIAQDRKEDQRQDLRDVRDAAQRKLDQANDALDGLGHNQD